MINKTEQIVTCPLQQKQNELKRICIAYQKHLYKELIAASYKIHLSYDYKGNSFPNEKTGLPYPTIIHIENCGNKNIEALQLAVKKYNKIQQLRDTLYGNNIWKNQENFEKIFNDPETVQLISKHRDSTAILFLKNLAYVLSSIALGAGLIASYYRKNSVTFWRSHGAITINALQEAITPHSLV